MTTLTNPKAPTAAEVRARLATPIDEAPVVRAAIAAAAPLLERHRALRERDRRYREVSDPNLRLHVERSVSRDEVLSAAEQAPTPGALAAAEREALHAERAADEARRTERRERKAVYAAFMRAVLPSLYAALQAADKDRREVGEIEYLHHCRNGGGGFFNPVCLPQLSGLLELAREEARRSGLLDE